MVPVTTPNNTPKNTSSNAFALELFVILMDFPLLMCSPLLPFIVPQSNSCFIVKDDHVFFAL